MPWHCVFLLSTYARHIAARVGAPPTDVAALLHRRIVLTHSGTALCALSTDIGADPAHVRMEVRGSRHEVGACLTNLCAIEQKSNVRWLGVFAAHLKAVGGGFGADTMAVRAVLNAGPHFLGDFMGMWHVCTPCFNVLLRTGGHWT